MRHFVCCSNGPCKCSVCAGVCSANHLANTFGKEFQRFPWTFSCNQCHIKFFILKLHSLVSFLIFVSVCSCCLSIWFASGHLRKISWEFCTFERYFGWKPCDCIRHILSM